MRLVNIKRNFNKLVTNNYEVWFSYETPIALYWNGKMFISINEWSNTTGKHLNFIDRDKSKRIPHDDLMRVIREVI